MTNATKIPINEIKINKISQRDIADTAADELCMWQCEIFMGWSYGRRINADLPCPTLEDLNRLNDLAIAQGGLRKKDSQNSANGFVANHEINFRLGGGPKGYVKKYEYFKDAGFEKVVHLLQWGVLVELRDEGRHSLIANGSYVESGKAYLSVVDPWPKTDDTRMDCSRLMTQRLVGGRWVYSRSIECFAWYYKEGSNPQWV